MRTPPNIADRASLDRNRSRMTATFMLDAVADEIQERLIEVNRPFNAPAIVSGQPEYWATHFPDAVQVTDTDLLALDAGRHDLVIHAMSMHWANDPIGQIVQSRHALKPDGLFLSAMFGGQTLHELRSVLAEAESRVTGGLSPRVAPMAEIRDLGALLQRSGMALPVADAMPLNVTYEDAWALMRDLRAMGEANALSQRLRKPTRRAVFAEAAKLYAEHFSDADGRIRATFEVIFLTGWAPDESQQKPLRPGSATARLADALGAKELNLPQTDD